MNATGTAQVSKTGFTKLALREGHDALNSAFAGANGQFNMLAFHAGDQPGTATDPVLEITYTPPTSAHGATVAQDVAYVYDAVSNVTGLTDVSETASRKTAT